MKELSILTENKMSLFVHYSSGSLLNNSKICVAKLPPKVADEIFSRDQARRGDTPRRSALEEGPHEETTVPSAMQSIIDMYADFVLSA